jgi:hypothetical protein
LEVPVSKDAKEIKITDKRMFTADGELREEYRFLAEKSTAAPPDPAAGTAGAPAATAAAQEAAAPAAGAAVRADQPPAVSPEMGASPPTAGRSAKAAGRPARGADRDALYPAQSGGGDEGGDEDEYGARLEIPGSPPGLGPSFYDLAAMLAEPVAVYLGDVELPDGQSAENLEMARLYIDLLDVLRQKTAGNLTAQESAFLEDLLYRMRVRYVQKRG